jgi:hypothetical protein
VSTVVVIYLLISVLFLLYLRRSSNATGSIGRVSLAGRRRWVAFVWPVLVAEALMRKGKPQRPTAPPPREPNEGGGIEIPTYGKIDERDER